MEQEFISDETNFTDLSERNFERNIFSMLKEVNESTLLTPIQYTNTYIWNLGRWQRRPCMQDRKKDTDVYNGLLDSEGEGEGGMIWENGIVTYILSCKNRIASLCLMQDTLVFYPTHDLRSHQCKWQTIHPELANP